MTGCFRLELLGKPRLLQGDTAWVLPLERRTQLLVLLGLAGGWVGRREAATLLWPDAAGPAVAANLRKTLFRLAALPYGAAVVSDGGALRFDGETDAAQFDAALRDGRIEEALALWRGEALAGFDDDANAVWTERVQHARDRLRSAWRGAAAAWLERDLPPGSAIALSARLLDDDPWDEAALQLYLRWLQAGNQASLAQQVHARFVERVRADLGVEPSAALLALVPAGPAPGAPAPKPAPPVRMPTAAAGAVDAGFIGRGAELRRIASLLEPDDGRLVTLLGPGGSGKTRLARRVAQELAAGFADGVAVAALEDLVSPDELVACVARESGLDAQGGSGVNEERLLQHLRGRQMLLVLDNFEHLVTGAALLARMLQRCPGIKLIITSRVRLGLAEEQLLPVEGLPVPEPEDADCIETFDAVRLFVRAAHRAHPAFAPAAEAPAIIEICARVGGLPLALELAAAWTRVLSCAEIAAELARGTELLQSADPARPARHASMAAVFEQSWRLLGEAERHALARLSLFRGGFGAEAARAVAGAAPPVLAALADRSLLAREGTRMHLHPLVQQYTAARLAGSEGAREAARSHARHFLGWLARLRSAVHDGAGEALRQIDADADNCRAAWQWAAADGDAEAILRSAETLCDYCDHRGRVGEALGLFEAALAQPALAGTARARGPLRVLAAHLLYRLDRFAEAQAAAREALALATAQRDDETRLQALNTLGSCAMQLGRLDEAAAHYGEHLRLMPAASDPHRAAGTMMNLAIVEQAATRLDRAQALFAEALVLAQRFGDAALEVRCLHNLALLHLARGEFGATAARLDAALELCNRHGFATTRAYVLGAWVDHARMSGDFEAAQRHVAAATAAARANGQRGLLCGLMQDSVHIALHRGEPDAARQALAGAAALALDLGRPSTQLSVAAWFAELLAATGERGAAVRVLDQVIAHAAASDAKRAELGARRLAWAQEGTEDSGEGWRASAEGDGAAPAAPDVEEILRRVAAEAGIAQGAVITELRAAARPGR